MDKPQIDVAYKYSFPNSIRPPWKIEPGKKIDELYIVGRGGMRVARVWNSQYRQEAATTILEAVNSYEPHRALITELVEALEKAHSFIWNVSNNDPDELAADGGVTVAMVNQKEATALELVCFAALTRAKEALK